MLTALRAGVSSCAGLLALVAPVWADSSAPMLRQVTGGSVPDNLNVGVQISSGLIWAPFGLVNKMTGAPTLLSTTREIYPTHAALVTALTTGLFNTQARTVSQQGYATAGDGGAADYDWNAVPPAATDNLFTLAPADGVGRFVLRVPAEGIHPEVAGAVGYAFGAATRPDDGPSISALSIALSALGGGTIVGRPGRFYDIGETEHITHHVTFKCPGDPMGQANTGDLLNFTNGGLSHPAAAQVLMDKASGAEGCVVIKSGLAQQAASTQDLWNNLQTWMTDGSQGLTVNGQDVRISRVASIGWTWPFYSEGFPRLRLRDSAFDGVNGVHVGAAHDTFTIDNVWGNNLWAGNLNGHDYAYAAAPVSAGTSTCPATLTVSGGTQGSGGPAKIAATVGGGGVTAATIAAVGDYTALPANPVSVVECSATFNLSVQSAAYRQATAFDFNGNEVLATTGGVSITGALGGGTLAVTAVSAGTILPGQMVIGSGVTDNTILQPYGTGGTTGTGGLGTYAVVTANNQTGATSTQTVARESMTTSTLLGAGGEGAVISNIRAEGDQTGLYLSNNFGLNFIHPVLEPDSVALPSHHPIGLSTVNCADQDIITNPYIQGFYVEALLRHMPLANGGACPASWFGIDAQIEIEGGNLATADTNALDQIDIGPYARGTVFGTGVAGTGGIHVGPNAGKWDFDVHDPTGGSTRALFSIDATATDITVMGPNMLRVPNLPTSSSGLTHGDVWNNSGVLNIVP